MTKLKLTTLAEDILRFLFIYTGKSFTGRAIANSLNVSQPGVSKALSSLRKEEVIKIEKDNDTKRLTIELNRDNPKVIKLKRADNLQQMYESGIVEFLEDEFPGATLILFGSYSRGEDTYTSDIDLAIIGRKEKELDLLKYDDFLKRKITINYYQKLNQVHKELRENLCNGIVLLGGIEL